MSTKGSAQALARFRPTIAAAGAALNASNATRHAFAGHGITAIFFFAMTVICLAGTWPSR